MPTATPTNPFLARQAIATDVGSRIGASVPLEEDFMQTVFNELKPGEAGVAGDADRATFYVVYVEPQDDTGPSAAALSEPYFQPYFISPYQFMAQRMKMQAVGSNTQWRQDLFNEYDVRVIEQN